MFQGLINKGKNEFTKELKFESSMYTKTSATIQVYTTIIVIYTVLLYKDAYYAMPWTMERDIIIL